MKNIKDKVNRQVSEQVCYNIWKAVVDSSGDRFWTVVDDKVFQQVRNTIKR